MRVAICGAGPGGLYLAVLLKRGDPTHDVTVFERNPRGATYGWGVVFSDDSLAELRDADYESYLAIDDALVRWNAIDVLYAGERIRSVGHGFAAVARTSLLRLLAERATSLGVDIRYEQPIEGTAAVAALCAEHDLVVGADGVRSAVRSSAPERFGTTLAPHPTRYVWFGADVALPEFTFLFRPTEHGLFQVHSYPFDASTSTFIVECTEATWRRAGLDGESETESLAFCQHLFAQQLGDHKLLSNASAWTTFVTLRNRSWYHDNIVLLGDAAHTAHFSIGSGTRLALADAIALAAAVVAHPGDLGAGFAEYEGERQPVVDRFQEVATDSSRYFESVARYLRFAPEQFAFNLLTRSGRITHLELERRDPVFVHRVDRWFADAPPRAVVVPPPALVPLRLSAACELTNRVVVAGAEQDVTGAGLVVTDPVAPTPDGRVTPQSPGLWDDGQTAARAAVVERIHAGGARVALRLTHAGRRGATAPRRRGLDRPLPAGEAWPIAAAAAVPYTTSSQVPRPLDAAGRERILEAYGGAARRAALAGVDVLLLDMSDGYLLAGFLSPLANPDGGDLRERAGFPLAVLDVVRAAWPGDRPLAVRLVADDHRAGGLTPADAVELARRLVDGGCSLVDVTSGHSAAAEHAAADYRRGFNVALADRVRNEAGVAVMVGGHINRLDQVNTIVAAGRSDLCILDRGANG